MTDRRTRPYDHVRRVIDLVVASCGLIILAPVLAVVALLVRRNLGAPVLFRQERPGADGRPFELLKFRTMKSGDGSDEERLTPFGSALRSTSLDELPELVNVVRGEMSLVGPRPLLMQYLPLYSDRQATRHRVRPGLTGLAQTSGRNSLSWPERLELDAQYVERRSPMLDLKIVGRTVVQVTRRSDISAADHVTMSPFRGQR